MNDSDNIRIPDGLSARLEEKLLSAALAEQDLDRLFADGGRRPQRPRQPRRWLWAAAPAIALASLATVLWLHRPRPLPPEAARAFSEFETAFNAFSEAINEGYGAVAKPFDF